MFCTFVDTIYDVLLLLLLLFYYYTMCAYMFALT